MTKLLGLLVALTLAVVGCTGGGDGDQPQSTAPTTPSLGGGDTTFNQGPCSLVIIVQGNPTIIRGDRGATISVGGLTIVFGPDCSSTVTTTNKPGA